MGQASGAVAAGELERRVGRVARAVDVLERQVALARSRLGAAGAPDGRDFLRAYA